MEYGYQHFINNPVVIANGTKVNGVRGYSGKILSEKNLLYQVNAIFT